MIWPILLIATVVVIVLLIVASRQSAQRAATALADAIAEARQVNERLGGQIYNLTGTDDPSRQALADAAERHNAAGSQIDLARTPAQAHLARRTALEGLYYIRAARTAMNMDPGPAIPELEGRADAGHVSEKRTIRYDDRAITASPTPSPATPNYYPGGRVAGRPVPSGWYSEPWWRPALAAGAWGVGSALLFTSLFSGMSGVAYGTDAFENGYGDGFQDGLTAGQDDPALSGDWGSDPGNPDSGADPGASSEWGSDPGTSSDWGGSGDWGGGFDGGGFDAGGF